MNGRREWCGKAEGGKKGERRIVESLNRMRLGEEGNTNRKKGRSQTSEAGGRGRGRTEGMIW
jgi:hypothetical protein